MEETKELSVKEHIDKIAVNVREIVEIGKDFSIRVEDLQREVNFLNAKIESAIDMTPVPILSRISDLYSDLKAQIHSQKAENEALQKNITEIKKDRSVIKQHFGIDNDKISKLQEKLGFTKINS